MARLSGCSLTLVAARPLAQLRDTYYLYSDNFLASLILWNYAPSNSTLTSMAQNIAKTMQTYLSGYVPNPINQWMVLTHSVFAFNASADFILTSVNGATILTTQNNQSGYLLPTNYADVAFQQAIYYHLLGNNTGATNAYQQGVADWDGKGFVDCANPAGNYATYKLALYIYCSKLLGQSLQYPSALSTLQAMQNESSGGFWTTYNSNLQPISGTNTETTATAILALNLTVFHHQTYQTLSYSVTGGSGYTPPIFQANQIGLPTQAILTNTPGYFLFDIGSKWTATNPLTGSTASERWFTTQATTGTIGASSTRAFTYQHQFKLTMKVSGPGTVTPISGWHNAGAKVTITAKANSGHKFNSWTGSGTGSYTGTKNPATITMNSAITENANFS